MRPSQRGLSRCVDRHTARCCHRSHFTSAFRATASRRPPSVRTTSPTATTSRSAGVCPLYGYAASLTRYYLNGQAELSSSFVGASHAAYQSGGGHRGRRARHLGPVQRSRQRGKGDDGTVAATRTNATRGHPAHARAGARRFPFLHRMAADRPARGAAELAARLLRPACRRFSPTASTCARYQLGTAQALEDQEAGRRHAPSTRSSTTWSLASRRRSRGTWIRRTAVGRVVARYGFGSMPLGGRARERSRPHHLFCPTVAQSSCWARVTPAQVADVISTRRAGVVTAADATPPAGDGFRKRWFPNRSTATLPQHGEPTSGAAAIADGKSHDCSAPTSRHH